MADTKTASAEDGTAGVDLRRQVAQRRRVRQRATAVHDLPCWRRQLLHQARHLLAGIIRPLARPDRTNRGAHQLGDLEMDLVAGRLAEILEEEQHRLAHGFREVLQPGGRDTQPRSRYHPPDVGVAEDTRHVGHGDDSWLLHGQVAKIAPSRCHPGRPTPGHWTA